MIYELNPPLYQVEFVFYNQTWKMNEELWRDIPSVIPVIIGHRVI